MTTLKHYYELAKPGIVYGNVFTTLAGILFASHWHVSSLTLLATLFGIGLVIASACVFNNYLDRHLDRKMIRTRERALATGAISVRRALVYGGALGVLGFTLLGLYVNSLTAGVALVGFIVYVFAYTFSKRYTSWGVIIGAVSGAVPIVVGYTAVSNRLDTQALILFLILGLWQMPHFYAIALFRLDDYRAAKIPVFPAKKGIHKTKVHMVWFIGAFVVAGVSLTAFGYAGYTFFTVMLAVGCLWLWRALQGFRAVDNAKWARKLFFFSLIVLVSFSLMLSLSPFLP